MRIGIIASSGVGAFASAYRILRQAKDPHDFIVLTDRECGIEKFCHQAGIRQKRLIEANRDAFSRQAQELFQQEGGVIVWFYFSCA